MPRTGNTKVNLEDIDDLIINPATEEKQDAIISAINSLGGSVKYDSRLDNGATYMYVGEALPGSLDSDAVWRIKRYVQATLQGDWADGTEAFTKVWNDRATYTY